MGGGPLLFFSCLPPVPNPIPSSLLFLLLLLYDPSLPLWRPRPENGAADPDLAAPLRDGALKVVAHAHAQLQLLTRHAQLLSEPVAGLAQTDKVLVGRFRRGSHGVRPCDRADGHEALQLQVRAVPQDRGAERDEGVAPRWHAGFGVLA